MRWCENSVKYWSKRSIFVSDSSDAEILFTNIPLEERLKMVLMICFFDKSKIDNLAKQNVYDLLTAAITALGNAFLCHYEKE